MELSVADRLQILAILPAQASLATIRIVTELRSELSFSEEEIAEFDVEELGGMVRWNAEKAEGHMKEVTIGKVARGIIEKQLEKMNREEQVTASMISLYELFEMTGE
jgi:hypothetical protein